MEEKRMGALAEEKRMALVEEKRMESVEEKRMGRICIRAGHVGPLHLHLESRHWLRLHIGSHCLCLRVGRVLHAPPRRLRAGAVGRASDRKEGRSEGIGMCIIFLLANK
jgi:hypothetical protein